MKGISNRLLVLILTLGVFGILNTEMGIVGVIPYVAERFGVSVPDAGILVSGFALIVAIAGPTMPLLFSRMSRKTVMLLALGVFSACNLFSVVAPTFELLLAARVIPAAFHPLYVSMAMAVAQQTGDTAAERARNSAQVFVGVSAGMVVGAPVAGVLASSIDLSAAMAFFAIVTVAALMLTVAFVPSMPVEKPMSYGRQVAILKKPVVLASLLAAASINAAMFGFYSYLSDYLGSAVGMGAALVSGGLLVYGLANIVGNMAAGRALGVSPRAVMVMGPIALAVLYVALYLAGNALIAASAVLIALGVAVGVANTTDQYMVSRSAPEAPDFANGMFLTVTNLGTTVGTSVCGALITAGGTQLSVLGTLPCLALGVLFTVFRLRYAHVGEGDVA
ncbi:MFS transporter [Collinsella tanakaei]|nr:MFS transporter [Collinsella tanakaei]